MSLQATLLDWYFYALCCVPCPLALLLAWFAGCPAATCPGSAGTHGSWCRGAACSTRSRRSQPCRRHRRSAASSGAAAARRWPDLPREDTLGGDGAALMASCTLPTSWGHPQPPALSYIPGQLFPHFVSRSWGKGNGKSKLPYSLDSHGGLSQQAANTELTNLVLSCLAFLAFILYKKG